MPLDPVYKAMLDQMAAAGGPALTELPVSAFRDVYRQMQPLAPQLTVGAVEDRRIPGPGGDIPIRIYRPAGSAVAPVVLNFHGGGWVIGDLDTADAQCREMCRRAGVVVVSVDYRLAPEHRYPAAADDCYAATVWAAANAASFGGDGARLAVGGDSAGGNLAAVVALMARDREGPTIRLQVLVYPVTNARFDTGSYADNGEGYMLTRTTMQWFWDHYAPDEGPRMEAYASPLQASDLTGLPPALVMTAEYDPLRDEGEDYAARLIKAGVPTQCIRWPGLIHGFFANSLTVPAAEPPMARACAALREALA